MSKPAVKSAGSQPDPPSRLPDLAARIRVRRTQLGLTGADLAQRASISPSYVSLIENGAKVPDEDVAAQLAASLEDDADLYRAWVRAARLGLQNLDLLKRLEAASRTPAYRSLVESGQELPKLADADATAELSSRIREVATRLASPSPTEEARPETASVVSVPVLSPGTDPAGLEAAGAAGGVIERLLLDRRLFPASAQGLFAYEVAEPDMKHLRGVARPGDCVVLERAGRAPAPDCICAVRHPAGLRLSRVLASGHTLLLLPGEGENGFASIDLGHDQTPADLVVASHVLLISR